jgi:hypothetical protein
MTLRACPREKEVRALVLHGQWPEASGAELRAHVDDCRSCGDLVLVMEAFQSARAKSVAAANPASAGVLWWRAQLRRRKAAMDSIGRPILGAQLFALSVTLAIAAVFAVSQARHGFQVLSWFRELPQSLAFHIEDLWSSTLAMPQWGLLLVFGLAAVALLSGVVLYLDRQRQ